ncbi:MAG: DNA repair protein RadC [Nitrospira sp.]|nr:JAB domain-containing protein [Candidatus Manganitrophaceae bacterium]HIL35754.1 JAB domain-containing protein [Candidatus Manganitrophaceae bacterium]
MVSKIKEWPQGERPRERLLKEGAEVLSDAQLLAILLRTGSVNTNAVQLAIDLLTKFHTLQDISNLSISELCSMKGIGPAKAAHLKAAFEFGRRSLVPLTPGVSLSKSEDVFRHFSPLLRNSRKEIFKIILLDQKNKVLRDVSVSQGSLTETVVHPREVFNPAVRDSAASVIFLHNHPSGDPTPSHEDKEMTGRLVAAGSLLGIQVLDHVVIGNDSYFSFADAGFIVKPST